MLYHSSLSRENLSSGFTTRSDTNPAVPPQKVSYRLEISDLESTGIVPSMYCSENKGTDQLRNYCTADLRLCVCIYAKIQFSHDAAHLKVEEQYHKTMLNMFTKPSCADQRSFY